MIPVKWISTKVKQKTISNRNNRNLFLSESGLISWSIVCDKFWFVSSHLWSHSWSVGQANFKLSPEQKTKKSKQRKNLFSFPHITDKQNRVQYPLCLLTPLQLCQHWWAQASMSWIPSSSRSAKCRPTAPVGWVGIRTNRVPISDNWNLCSFARSR